MQIDPAYAAVSLLCFSLIIILRSKRLPIPQVFVFSLVGRNSYIGEHTNFLWKSSDRNLRVDYFRILFVDFFKSDFAS